MTYRNLVLAPVTVLAVAALAGPALAGTDSDDENGGPVATPAPAPFIQPPAPAPVAAPAPLAAPEQVPVQRLGARERVKQAKRRHHRSAHRRAVKLTRARNVVRTAGVPRGGVQAGFGGTAR